MARILKNQKQMKRVRRHARIRARIVGNSLRPRLSVFKSNKFLYAQIIDDSEGKTLVALSTKALKGKTMLEKASALGKGIAELALKQNLSQVTFDRGGYIYTGRIKAIADGARAGGLSF